MRALAVSPGHRLDLLNGCLRRDFADCAQEVIEEVADLEVDDKLTVVIGGQRTVDFRA